MVVAKDNSKNLWHQDLIYIYIWTRNQCVYVMCCTVTIKQKRQSLHDEFSYSFTSQTQTTFPDLHLYMHEGQIQTSLYDKRNSYYFNVVRIPYKSSTIPSKIFFAPLVQKSIEQLPLWYNLLKHLKFFYIKYWGKGQIL